MRKTFGVVILMAALALAGDTASAGWEDAEECLTAKDEAESAAFELSSAASTLAYCADAGDLDDDCSSEFYNVQSAHGDYESAVSDVDSYCN